MGGVGAPNPSDTIRQLKLKIQVTGGIPIDRQALCFAGHRLLDDRTCESYHLEPTDTIKLVMKIN